MPLSVRMGIFIALVATAAFTVCRLRPGTWGSFKKLWVDYFNESTHPANLAMCRILLFGFLCFYFDVSSGKFYASLPSELLVPPYGAGWILQHVPIRADLYEILARIFKISCFAAMVGFFTPMALISVFLSAWYVLGVPQFFGKVGHSSNIYLYASLVLAFSPCSDALSVDALIRRKPFFGGSPSASYARPLHMVWLLIGLVYFFPGVWKMVQGGPKWIFSDNLKYQLYQIWAQYGHTNFFRLDQWPILCRLSAAGVIMFEVLFMFFLLVKRWRWVCALVAVSFHNMTAWVMGIHFFKLMYCYTTFIDWAWLGRRLSGKKAAVMTLQTDPPPLKKDMSVKIGLTIFAINVILGLANNVNAWPFSCFPTFGWVQGPTSQYLAVEFVSADGRVTLMDRKKMNELWQDEDPHKIRGLSNMIMRTDGAFRHRLSVGLAKFIKLNHAESELVPAQVQFVKEIVWLDPARWSEPPVKRDVLERIDWSSL